MSNYNETSAFENALMEAYNKEFESMGIAEKSESKDTKFANTSVSTAQKNSSADGNKPNAGKMEFDLSKMTDDQMSAMVANGDVIEKSYKEAEDLKNGKKPPFEILCPAQCFHCSKSGMGFQVCGGCKAIGYCSQECQKQSWKVGSAPQFWKHKNQCKIFARQMARMQDVVEITKLFPWCKLTRDDQFDQNVHLATLKLLGDDGAGYWAISPSPVPHMHNKNMLGDLSNAGLSPNRVMEIELMRLMGQAGSLEDKHTYGYMYLHKKQLTDDEAWNGLAKEFRVPYEFGGPGQPQPPRRLIYGDVIESVEDMRNKRFKKGEYLKSWQEWHTWRNIPLESPVSLVMHNVLTIYHLMNSASWFHIRLPKHDGRVKMCIHLVGTEYELNSIGLFRELAILYPETDIRIWLFGHAVVALHKKAPKGSIAATGKLLEYTGPASLGSSTVTVNMYTYGPLWSRDIFDHITDIRDLPNIIIGLNAGLGDYIQEWIQVVESSIYGFPFLLTEYTETDLEMCRELILIGHMYEFGKFAAEDDPLMVMIKGKREAAVKEKGGAQKNFPIHFNPFHRPGPRIQEAARLPNLSNGFTLSINPFDMMTA